MRYLPTTDRAISIDEIAAQCRAAILKADIAKWSQVVRASGASVD